MPGGRLAGSTLSYRDYDLSSYATKSEVYDVFGGRYSWCMPRSDNCRVHKVERSDGAIYVEPFWGDWIAYTGYPTDFGWSLTGLSGGFRASFDSENQVSAWGGNGITVGS